MARGDGDNRRPHPSPTTCHQTPPADVELVRTFADARSRYRGRVSLVPTMGYFHEGHLALMRSARSGADTVVVSIFVNPLQFNDPSDLDRYPRDLERDLEMAEAAEVDLVFAPDLHGDVREPTHHQSGRRAGGRSDGGPAPPGSFRRGRNGGGKAPGGSAAERRLFRPQGRPATRRGEQPRRRPLISGAPSSPIPPFGSPTGSPSPAGTSF